MPTEEQPQHDSRRKQQYKNVAKHEVGTFFEYPKHKDYFWRVQNSSYIFVIYFIKAWN